MAGEELPALTSLSVKVRSWGGDQAGVTRMIVQAMMCTELLNGWYREHDFTLDAIAALGAFKDRDFSSGFRKQALC
jgi:hypothetical protein